MNDEVLDTDFLPLDMITTSECCSKEISKCDELRLALDKHQLELVKLYAKITDTKLVKITSQYNDVIINDYVICDKESDKYSAFIGDSCYFEIDDYGDGTELDHKEIEI